jgi:avidin family protein
MKHERAFAALLNRAAPRAAPNPFAGFAGTWKNEYDSTAEFTVNGSNVSGLYTSTVSGTNTTVKGQITGWCAGNLIAFTVLWSGNASMTAWVGQITTTKAGVETLETLWHLVTDISEDPTKVWQSVLAGADFFTRL